MQVIDMDSHLRERYFLDEVFKLDGEFAKFNPKRIGDGGPGNVTFAHDFTPSSIEHHWIYRSENNWLGGEIAERQVGGYDMGRRLADNDRAGIAKQFVFPTKISIPALEEGPLCENPRELVGL